MYRSPGSASLLGAACARPGSCSAANSDGRARRCCEPGHGINEIDGIDRADRAPLATTRLPTLPAGATRCLDGTRKILPDRAYPMADSTAGLATPGTPLKWHTGLTMASGSRPDGIARMPARFTHGQYGPRTNLGFKSGFSRTVDSGRGRASGNAQLKSPIPRNSVKSLTAHKKAGCCLHPRLTTCQNGISSSRSRP